MQLTAYLIDGHHLEMRPAPVEREWMDATHQRFAYRCLPLAIANAHGWELLCPSRFSAVWDGGDGLDAIRVMPDGNTTVPAISHFGHGVLTFHVPVIFRTEPGWDLMVGGPINLPKDAIAPLSGVVETDWTPFSFTMNWRFTRSGQRIAFEAGEPFCHVFPVQRGALEAVMPKLMPLSADPDLARRHREWSESRNAFNRDLTRPDSDAASAGWQKLYHRGQDAAGEQLSAQGHRTRLRLKPFAKKE